MQLPPKPRLSRHQRSRLIAWTLALLLWLARALQTGVAPARRHIRRRYAFFDLDWIARRICKLVLLRAHELARLSRRKPGPLHRYGQCRKLSGFLRSAFGARLRRALKHRDFATRISILIDALRRLDAFATRFAKRLQRKFTRLWPILATPGATPMLTAALASAPFADDSS